MASRCATRSPARSSLTATPSNLFIDDSQRQLCLAHVLRDFTALGERAGAPGRLGRKLSYELGAVFATLNAAGRDLADLQALRADLHDSREHIHDLLTQGTRCRDSQTRRFCAGLHETALRDRRRADSDRRFGALPPRPLASAHRAPQRSPLLRARKLCARVLAGDDHRCLRYGSDRDLQIDHISPHSLGGPTAEANLQTLCGRATAARAIRP